MRKSVGMMKFPIYGKIKNVPNHQPVVDFNDFLPRESLTIADQPDTLQKNDKFFAGERGYSH